MLLNGLGEGTRLDDVLAKIDVVVYGQQTLERAVGADLLDLHPETRLCFFVSHDVSSPLSLLSRAQPHQRRGRHPAGSGLAAGNDLHVELDMVVVATVDWVPAFDVANLVDGVHPVLEQRRVASHAAREVS